MDLLFGHSDEVGQWVVARAGGEWFLGQGYGIGVLEQGKMIAGIIFTDWNGVSLQIHVAAEPGVNWINKKLLRVVFDYPFVFCKAKKLIGLVGEKNLAARRFDEHVGFTREATLRDAHPDGDLLIYSMTPDQCRWLDRRGNGKEQQAA